MAYPFTKTLEHLGLVAGFCQDIKLAEIIDRALGDSGQRQVSFGKLFEAMILNGLGFTGRTLHMFSEYFEDKPLERLLGPGIQAEHINDDALGRCLDALYEHGVSPLYQTIGEAVVRHLDLPCEAVHLDSTSFHTDSQEKLSEGDFNPVQITKGYSRDHRPELNQVILNLICENQAGIPVYMKPASGNSNDLKGFKEIVKSHVQSLKAAQKSRWLVADSALYVGETLQYLDKSEQLFITRVPQRLKEATDLVANAHNLVFTPINEDYQGVWYQSDYADVRQRWLLLRSEPAHQRERKNLNGRMLKAANEERKSFKKLCQQGFACRKDAESALKRWQTQQTWLDVDASISEMPIYTGRGRPAAGRAPDKIEFRLSGQLFTPLKRRQQALDQLGLFIIATNDHSPSMSMDKLLSTYKSQQAVEKGFRFLKSPDFLTSSIFLKKPERIEALLMVMTTCLMVYAAMEHLIRKRLKEKDLYFPDQKKKPYQNPTARWVFQCFQGITIIYLGEQEPMVVNWKPRHQSIIDCLGDPWRQIYS